MTPLASKAPMLYTRPWRIALHCIALHCIAVCPESAWSTDPSSSSSSSYEIFKEYMKFYIYKIYIYKCTTVQICNHIYIYMNMFVCWIVSESLWEMQSLVIAAKKTMGKMRISLGNANLSGKCNHCLLRNEQQNQGVQKSATFMLGMKMKRWPRGCTARE